MEVELQLDGEVVLRGTARETDESFSHEFGVERGRGMELDNFRIYITVDGEEVDVSEGFEAPYNEKIYYRLKARLYEHAMNEMFDE